MHNQAPINRRKSTRIYVGKVPIGDGAPIAVQSMTNTRTTDVEATVNQIKALERVGVDIVRVSVPTMDAAEAFKLIKQQVNVPLVADIHFDYRIALQVAEYGVDCLRINPGNIGNESRIRSVVDCARDKNIPIRIGVNGGSLEKDLQEKYGEPTPEALLESAMRHVDILDRLNFDQFKVSVKASDVFWRCNLTACWPRASISRCIWASPKPAAHAAGRSNRPSAWACCCLKASATPCASRWRRIRSKK